MSAPTERYSPDDEFVAWHGKEVFHDAARD
jgi:hypothetical protein